MQSDLHAALAKLPPTFAHDLAAEAFSLGLAITSSDGTRSPISLAMTPVVLDTADLESRRRLSEVLARATLKTAQFALRERLAILMSALSPLERAFAIAGEKGLTTIPTTRVDYFWGPGACALEVNATIPAMQGYSDIAAGALVSHAAKAWGADRAATARLVASAQVNSRALYDALLQAHRQARAGNLPNRIALLCRRNDAQLTEQQFLAAAFSRFGTESKVVHPDELDIRECLCVDGKPVDLVYRHLFLRRLEESLLGAEKVLALLQGSHQTLVFNPPASQVEVKAVMALLSKASEDASLAQSIGLGPQELEAAAVSVPWTRMLSDQASRQVALANPDGYVLKRSWDYGGRAVFLGRSRGEPGFAERATATFGPGDWTWERVCAAAANDLRGGGFIVQALVPTRPTPHLLCSETEGAVPADIYVDYSGYASVGLDEAPKWGGVCRGSASPIVNILGGGGVLPLLTDDIAEALWKLSRDASPGKPSS